jgi:uncharacterized membrane protein YdcZ (DUF606 family)
MPGPAGAAWPAASPGTWYCGPYPSCCPRAVTTAATAHVPWWQYDNGYLGLIVLFAAVGVAAAVMALVSWKREARR